MSRLLRTILIVLGLTIALTSTGLGLLLAREEPPAIVQARKAATVIVAARQIPAGHRIEKADLGWKEVGTASVPAGAFARPAQSELNVIGSVALRNLAAGELIAQQHLAPAASGDSLAGNLNPGWRAITFAADASQTSAGMLLPNDRVDLILAVPASQPNSIQAALPFAKQSGVGLGNDSSTIGNVRVIAINGTMRSKADAGETAVAEAKGGGTVTLEVRPEQVAAILGAASSGRLGIALRSRFDSASPGAQPPAANRPAQPARTGAAPTAKAAKPAKPSTIRSISTDVIIIRGWEKSRAN